jgi:hypothetical protein
MQVGILTPEPHPTGKLLTGQVRPPKILFVSCLYLQRPTSVTAARNVLWYRCLGVCVRGGLPVACQQVRHGYSRLW